MNENMIPFENMVADYIKETGNRVLYRATPVYSGNNLVCSGVLLEAYSIEDKGEGLSFNVFLYNVQPQIWINYATGESRYVGEGKDLGDLGVGGNVNNETTTPDNNENNNGGNTEEGGEQVPVEPDAPVYDDIVKKTYVINKNSGKIHCADCSSVGKMSESNKLVVELTEKELQDLIGSTEGKVTYSACLTCNPDKKAVVATAATASDDED
jgi:DNA-entry nuclease